MQRSWHIRQPVGIDLISTAVVRSKYDVFFSIACKLGIVAFVEGSDIFPVQRTVAYSIEYINEKISIICY